MVRVLRRIERREVLVNRQGVAVLLDQIRDVVAFSLYRQGHERPANQVARRKIVLVIPVHGDGLVVPRHHHHIVIGLTLHRALPEFVVVRIRVCDKPQIREEVPTVHLVVHESSHVYNML